MDKLIGTMFILVGCAGMLMSWYERQKKRQRTMAAFIRLLSSWEYSLEREKTRLPEFLVQYTKREPQIADFLEELQGALEEKNCPTGAALWRKVLHAKRRSLDLDDALLEILLPASGAFFGNNRRESIQCAGACRMRLEDALSGARAELARKQRVYMPVGMLFGVLLIILLI